MRMERTDGQKRDTKKDKTVYCALQVRGRCGWQGRVG